jgi:hypothetical protein
MSDLDLTKLREVAEGATAGPWVEDDGNIFSKPLSEVRFASAAALGSG